MVSPLAGPDWEAFPAGLRQDLESYLVSLGQIRRTANNKRLRPSKASTIRTRRAELVAFVRKAVAIGIPLDTLTSLSTLLDPDRVERVLDAYWGDGEIPNTYTIELAGKLFSMARQTQALDDLGLERLDEMRAELEQYRRGGLTEKNLTVIRQVRTGSVWSRVVSLPHRLMADAADMPHAPVRAAVKAQLAVALALLTVAPVRLGNLVRIRLEENLIRPSGPLKPF